MQILIYKSISFDASSNLMFENFLNKNKRLLPKICLISKEASPLLNNINHSFTHIIQKNELSKTNSNLLFFIKNLIDKNLEVFLICEKDVCEHILQHINRLLNINNKIIVSNDKLFQINNTYNYNKIRALPLESLI